MCFCGHPCLAYTLYPNRTVKRSPAKRLFSIIPNFLIKSNRSGTFSYFSFNFHNYALKYFVKVIEFVTFIMYN